MRRLFVVALALALSGCATFPGRQAARIPAVGSGEAVQVNRKEASKIAGDILKLLKKDYGPGQTVFVVSKKNGPIGERLRGDLRSAGYGVSVAAPSAAPGTRLTYLADNYDPGRIVVGVGVGETFYAMRLYDLMPSGSVEGEGGWTVREVRP